MRTSRRNGFTLIEMLTVIVIIAVILGIGLPAFTNLMKSGGLSGASREVANALGLARQYAITHRTTTRIVFPYSGTIGTIASATNLCPWYQSYAVLDIGSTNYVSKWDHLPLGTVFMCDSVLLGSGTHPCLDTLTLASLPFPNTNSSSAMLAYIEFNPTGAASNPGTLTITEGFMSGTNVVPTS